MKQNIFGRSVEDYKHLSLLDKHGKLKAHLNAMMKDSKNPQLFDAKAQVGRFKDDTQALGFLTNNLMAIQSEILEVQFTAYRLPDLIPIINNIPVGATTYGYRVMNETGEGTFIENYGHEAKDAEVSAGLVSASMYPGGIKGKWSYQDLQSAMMLGMSLDSQTIEAATLGALKHIERVGLTGSDAKNIKGLINQTGVTVITAPATFASSTDGQSVVDTINNAINSIIVQTNEVVGRNIRNGLTIYLPTTKYNFLSTFAYGALKYQSLAQWLSKNNAWTSFTGNDIEVKSVIELKGAGTAPLGSDRMVIAFNDRSVMEMAIVDPRVLDILREGFFFVAPIYYKMSGLNVKLPAAMVYIDGI